MTFRYRLKFEPDDNGTVLVTSPDFPPLVTFGDDEEDARMRAKDALDTLIASMLDSKEPIPPPSDDERGPAINLPLSTSLKIELHRAMLESGVDRAELGRRLGWRGDATSRLFRLSYSSRISDFDKAFRALGRDIAIEARFEPIALSISVP